MVRQELILTVLRSHGPMTVCQILDKLDIPNNNSTQSSCNSALRKMRKWGEVKKVGTIGPRGHIAFVWEAVEW